MINDAVSLYIEIIKGAIPYALVFGLCNLVVNLFMSAAFGGRLKLGGGR